MSEFVLDNSVCMRWCFQGDSTGYADAVLRRITQGDEAIVPIFWRYEASNVLARAQKIQQLPVAEVDQFLSRLHNLPIIIDYESAERVLTDVHLLALRYRLTTYDASYLEVALRRQIPLATLDDELCQACETAGVKIFE